MESKPIHVLLNEATSEELLSDDWEIILEITDKLNEQPDESVPLLLKLIEKKFQATQNPKVLLLSLTLLDACVKNCPHFRKAFGTSKHLLFLADLAESLKDKSVLDQLKNFLKEWTESFGQKYENFGYTYRRITGKAVEPKPQSAPSTNVAAPSPAPRPATAPQQSGQPQNKIPQSSSSSASVPKISKPASKLSPKEKLLNDLNVVVNNIKDLKDKVDAFSGPQPREITKSVVIQQLVVNCREMQRRLVRLVESIPEEEILMKAIQVNEVLFESITYFENFVKTGIKRNTAGLNKMISDLEKYMAGKINLEDIPELASGGGQAASSSSAAAGKKKALIDLDDIFGAEVYEVPAETNNEKAKLPPVPNYNNGNSNNNNINNNQQIPQQSMYPSVLNQQNQQPNQIPQYLTQTTDIYANPSSMEFYPPQQSFYPPMPQIQPQQVMNNSNQFYVPAQQSVFQPQLNYVQPPIQQQIMQQQQQQQQLQQSQAPRNPFDMNDAFAQQLLMDFEDKGKKDSENSSASSQPQNQIPSATKQKIVDAFSDLGDIQLEIDANKTKNNENNENPSDMLKFD